MNTYIFKTSATMKPYNCDKWWIDGRIIGDEFLKAETVSAALEKYAEKVKNNYCIEVSANALKNKQPLFIDNHDGKPEQVGYFMTAKTIFQNDFGKCVNQYIDLYINIITTTRTIFDTASNSKAVEM